MKKSAKLPPAPKSFSDEAKRLWRALVAEFDIDDEAGRLLLSTALEAFERLRAAQRELDRDGITILDRWGQRKPHPATIIERDARSGMLNALRALKLDPNVITRRK